MHNIKNISKTISLMNKLGIEDMDGVIKAFKSANSEMLDTKKEIKKAEKIITTSATLLKNIDIYKKYKKLYTNYKNSSNKADLYRAYSDKIILFESALKVLKANNIKDTDKSSISLKSDLKQAKTDKDRLMKYYQGKKKKVREINTLKDNIEIYLNKKASQ